YLMASNQYLHLSTRVVADSGGKTFLKFIEENNIFASQGKPLTIRGLGRSRGKGTAGADRSIIYRRDPSCIQMKCDDVTFLA
ncbi:major capsid family protein, partial [Acinetobacter baumannii]